jgi:hypothetical protein
MNDFAYDNDIRPLLKRGGANGIIKLTIDCKTLTIYSYLQSNLMYYYSATSYRTRMELMRDEYDWPLSMCGY